MTTDDSAARDEARRDAEASASERLFQRVIDRLGGSAGVRAVFGEPIERDGLTVVPVARARWFFGAGGGSGPNPDAAAEGTSSGTGMGGGAGVTPIGFLEITSSGAAFKPIVDAYPSPVFLLAVGLMAAVVIRALARLLRS